MPTLRDIRVEKDMSQLEVALQAGTSQGIISRAETGKAIRKTTLARICEVLGIEMGEFEDVRIYSPVRDRRRWTKRKTA